MRSSDITASIAHRWVKAWTSADAEQIQAVLADEVTVEHNLGLPAERSVLIDTIVMLAGAIEDAHVLSLTTTDRRAALLYDCLVRHPAGSIRLAEFLDLDGERVVGIRRVYDLTAVDQLMPMLHEHGAS